MPQTSVVENPITELRNQISEFGLISKSFYQLLENAAKEIKSGVSRKATEATVAGYFERVLYATLKEIGIKFNPEKEESIETHRHINKGRMDSRVGAVVIEYKRPVRLETDKQINSAVEQLETYLIALSQSTQTLTYGFLTSGAQFLEIYVLGGTVRMRSNLSEINAKALMSLSKNIRGLDLIALTSQSLVSDFCGVNNDGVLFDVARNFYSVLGKDITEKTKMLRSEWEEIFRLGHDDRSQQTRIQDRRKALAKLFNEPLQNAEQEYKALFALHTAYALIIKLMAYRVVSDLGLSRQWTNTQWSNLLNADSNSIRAFCEGLEDGEIFRNLGILNLLEGDFFSWYSDKNQWNDIIADGVKSILQTLGKYEQAENIFSSSGAIDLFRELYEAFIPQPVRSSFGEFYTPHWLASHVIDSAIQSKSEWRLLDPCAGSGTFLITAIEKIRRENIATTPEYLLELIVRRVVGIDLNPLAVLASRVNYFMHVADLITDNVENMIIPVFLGDASNIPTNLDIDGIKCITYLLRTTLQGISVKITLPLSVIKDTPSFVIKMLEFEKAVQRLDYESAFSLLRNQIPDNERTDNILNEVNRFTLELIELEKKGWNGIWARIFSNFLSTAALEHFDAIVGNPPWIDWKNLPENYRRKIKALCIDKGLFSGDGRTGGINLNVCALISHVSVTNWLKEDGKLAFLMPKELAYQQSYQGWRRLNGKTQRYIERFIDWTHAGHPFDPVKEDFMTYIIGKDNPGKFTPVTTYKKKTKDRSKSRLWKDLETALNHLDEIKQVAGRIVPASTAFTFADSEDELTKFSLVAGKSEYLGREGAEFYPQELLLFKYEGNGRKLNTAFLRNIQKTKSKYKIQSQTKLLETKYIFPLVKGSDIEPFNYNYRGYIVPFPYKSDDPHKPISSDVLSKESPLLLEYYHDYEEIIRSQTDFSDKIRGANSGEYYGIARTGLYSFAENYVCFRDNTKWCAAVVSTAQMPWGEHKRFVFQNHAASICERPDGGFITEDEAHYICAILNAPAVSQFIYASSDERSFKIRIPVYIPVYNPKDVQHKKLTELSKKCHAEPNNISSYLKKIEDVYISICLERLRTQESNMPKTDKKISKITNEKPVSLYPLDFREAVAALLKIKPKSKEEKAKGKKEEKSSN